MSGVWFGRTLYYNLWPNNAPLCIEIGLTTLYRNQQKPRVLPLQPLFNSNVRQGGDECTYGQETRIGVVVVQGLSPKPIGESQYNGGAGHYFMF